MSGYFAEVSGIISAQLQAVTTEQDNSVLKGFVGMLNFQCQQLDSETSFEYKVSSNEFSKKVDSR